MEGRLKFTLKAGNSKTSSLERSSTSLTGTSVPGSLKSSILLKRGFFAVGKIDFARRELLRDIWYQVMLD